MLSISIKKTKVFLALNFRLWDFEYLIFFCLSILKSYPRSLDYTERLYKMKAIGTLWHRLNNLYVFNSDTSITEPLSVIDQNTSDTLDCRFALMFEWALVMSYTWSQVKTRLSFSFFLHCIIWIWNKLSVQYSLLGHWRADNFVYVCVSYRPDFRVCRSVTMNWSNQTFRVIFFTPLNIVWVQINPNPRS